MKWLFAALAVIGLTGWAGMHSQPDAGDFRLVGEATIAPASDSVLRALLYRKPLLLTFDDGPEDAATDARILAILRKHHARAIWFLNCKNFDPAMNPNAAENRKALAWIRADGHLLGNHTYTHPNLTTLAPGNLGHEIGGCSQAIARETGVAVGYFRPPFGVSTPASKLAAAGMRTVLWSGNSYDSFQASFKTHPQQYVDLLTASQDLDIGETAQAGDVVLLHDFPNTALALDGILTRLEARGFQFVVPD